MPEMDAGFNEFLNLNDGHARNLLETGRTGVAGKTIRVLSRTDVVEKQAIIGKGQICKYDAPLKSHSPSFPAQAPA